MKVIFLDIDGVLNHKNCTELIEEVHFVEDSKVAMLKQIVDETDANLVLSSSWRYGWIDNGEQLESLDLDCVLFKALVKKLDAYEMKLLSKTPIHEYGDRDKEISMWLDSWNGERIDTYIVLDDLELDEFPTHMNKLIKTEYEVGLTEEIAQEAIRKLQGI